MPLRLPLLALAALFLLPLSLPRLAAADVEPATATEVVYWRDLQADIAAFRAANSDLPTMIIEMSIPQLNDAMDRIEAFLDDRDDEADQVEEFGADIQEYHKNLIALFEAAIAPLTEGAKYQEQANRANPMARMMAGAKTVTLMEQAEDFKPTLRDLHEAITARIVAAGGPNIFFFQGLNLTDKNWVSGRGLTPLERDERFIAESASIDEGLGLIAEHYFIPLRKDGRSPSEIAALRDKLLELLQEFGDSLANMSNVQIEGELSGLSPDLDPNNRGRLLFVLHQELVRRERDSDAAFRLIDWQACFARWFGDATANSLDLASNDLAVSYDGERYAYCSDLQTVVIRSAADDAIIGTQTLEGEVRGMAFDFEGRLMAFTTKGLFRWDVADEGEPYLRDNTASANLTGAIDTAATVDRFVQGWAHIPGFTRGNLDTKITGRGASNITSAAMSRDGLHAAYGFSGTDNLGNGEKPYHGVVMIGLPPDMSDDTKLTSKFYFQAFRGPVTDIAFDDDASHFAFCLDTGEVVVYERGSDEENRRQLTIDNQPYTFVTFLPGDEPRVLAAARNGVIRIWNYDTLELQQRFVVPTGPAGVAVGLAGDVLVTAALGAEDLHRWNVATGEHLATIMGRDPVIDSEALAAAIETERTLRPAIDTLRQLYDFEDDERETFARQALAEQGDLIDQLGRRSTLVNSVASNIAERIRNHNKADEEATAAELGLEAIEDGFTTMSVYYGTVTALLNLDRLDDANRLLDEGIQVYPSSSDLRYLYQWQRMQRARKAGNLTETLAAIDEIDLIRPKNRPHTGLRIDAHTIIAYQKTKAGQQRAALDLNLKALDICRTKDQQLEILPNAFSLAYQLKDWKLTVGIANMWMQVDPAKKNDSQFMEWARYAYSQMPK
ncbi:WD40 repeat domain-containing protein [Actomonas aquatica]|uniref:Anaphase-promoting complex subunit 4 WD40 domain-containing protein n=1 Tax=Actomonas aquatica TaxID=2866162 RepID=A0ABZ1C973_9BACT|nr:hypothetical protein [Opitutus sp. WL0086]WRQ87129.1 hypothetical protein K1X11_020140 [Opitutus sp. WL0086]